MELNNTFYRPPNPGYCRRWVKDVADREDFLYTAKLWQRFTHEREGGWKQEDVDVFRDGIAPLVEAGRLAALLVQFPWSFRYSAHSERCVEEIAGGFSDLPLVLE
ncbi:MAG: DUF72 domain-containing protein, partial [Planctomycetota bacterium]